MNTYVFLGPSLPIEQARRYLDATYLPPVQQGDVLRLLAERVVELGYADAVSHETVRRVLKKTS